MNFSICRISQLILIVFFSWAGINSAMAQNGKEWTLEKSINYAFDNNIDILKSKLNTQTAKATLLQSKLDLIPSLNLGGTHSFGSGKTLSQLTNTYENYNSSDGNIGLQTSLTLSSGLAKINTILANKLDLDATNYDINELKNTIALNITAAYLDILFNQELVKVAQAQVSVSKEQVARTEKLVAAGSKARGDLLNVKSQLAKEEEDLVKNENALYISKVNFQQFLDLPISPEFMIFTPEFDVELNQNSLKTPEVVYGIAENTMPEIKGAELRLQSAEKGIQIARGNYYPSLSLNGSYGSRYAFKGISGSITAPFFEQIDNNKGQSISFNLSIPIFNNFKARTNVNKARIYRESASYDLDKSKLKLRKSVESAYTDAIAAWRSYQSSMASVSFYQESFKYTEQKFEVGLVSSYDYNLSKSQLTQAESNLIQAKFQYIFKSKVLDFYTGNPLSL